MSAEIPSNSPEKDKMTDDNARKFVVGDIDTDFLLSREELAYFLTTDWLKMDDDYEVKVVCKKYEHGDVERLLIEKIRNEDGRTAVPPKKKLSEDEYESLRKRSICHVDKIRHEFKYQQGEQGSSDKIELAVKYDEFVNSTLRILEVDADSDAERDLFDKDAFPYALKEVTGKMEYYGYRVADIAGGLPG